MAGGQAGGAGTAQVRLRRGCVHAACSGGRNGKAIDSMNSMSVIRARFARIVTVALARAVVMAALALAAAIAVLAPSAASAETRSLKLYFVHTGEKAEIAFKKDGRYLPDGLKRLNVFLRDWRRNEPTKMDPRLFDLVWQVYQSTGSHEYINVVSAYRSPATNAMLRSSTRGVAKRSQHMLGHAMDYFIPGVPLAKLRAIGMRYQIGGVGYYPRSGSPFVHMDVGNVRHWPRMTRRELLALFPDGKTVHIPSDGKPLPGYEAALAMVEKRKSSGGSIMMASASSSRKSKSLFGMLFGGGGGADEEEDNGDGGGGAVTRPARGTARPVPAVPDAPVQQPRETMVAALPAREAPLPMEAPRPAAGLEDAPAAPPVAAFANVPVPARKPAMTAQDAVEMAAADPAAAERAAVDANTNQLADGVIPIPATRPQTDTAPMVAVIPGQRPERPGETPAEQPDMQAVASAEGEAVAPQPGETAAFPLPEAAPRPGEQAAPQQLALASRRDEIGELIGPPSDDYDDKAPAPVQPARPTSRQPAVVKALPSRPATVAAALDTGVRTTAKGARYVAKAPARPSAVVRPVSLPTSEVAMSSEPVSRAVPVTNPVLRNDAMRAAPTMVYTTGFQRDLPGEQANQFSGRAVTFLTVAKFSATN